MKALQFKNDELKLNAIEQPVPQKGEALVKVLRAGVCNTDIEIINGYFGFEGTLGHEFVGEVVECSDSSWVGKRIVADINCACRSCDVCDEGDFHHCPDRSVIGILKKDGAFAEYLTVPVSNLVAIPDEMDLNYAIFAEPLAAALEIQEQVNLRKDQEICVLGDGKLGLLIAMSLVHSGYDVTLVGHHPERLSKMGENSANYATHAPENSYPVVIEATGTPDGFEIALGAVMPRGTLVLKSTYAASLVVNTTKIVVDEITLVGSRCGPMAKAVELLSAEDFDPIPLIDESFTLANGVEALEKAKTKGILKVVLDMTS